MDDVVAWLEQQQGALQALGVGSVVLSIASLAVLPWLVARIPVDYFSHDRDLEPAFTRDLPAVRLVFDVVRTIVGLVLVLAGVAMLVLPGQGVLTILAGIVLMRFPGKHRLEMSLARRPSVTRALQWLRRKGGAEPLHGLDDPASRSEPDEKT